MLSLFKCFKVLLNPHLSDVSYTPQSRLQVSEGADDSFLFSEPYQHWGPTCCACPVDCKQIGQVESLKSQVDSTAVTFSVTVQWWHFLPLMREENSVQNEKGLSFRERDVFCYLLGNVFKGFWYFLGTSWNFSIPRGTDGVKSVAFFEIMNIHVRGNLPRCAASLSTSC